MCKLCRYILPCGHPKYQHILKCGWKNCNTIPEDFAVEWTVKCALCEAKLGGRERVLVDRGYWRDGPLGWVGMGDEGW